MPKGAAVVAMDRKFPKIQETHRFLFVTWLIQFGDDRTGVKRAITNILDELELPDTRENRQMLRGRLRNCNPNDARCEPRFLEAFQRGREAQSGQLIETQDRRRALRRNRLGDELDRVECQLKENPNDNAAWKNFIALIHADRQEDEYEAKLHGLFPGTRVRESHESVGGNGIGDLSFLEDLPDLDQVEPGEPGESEIPA